MGGVEAAEVEPKRRERHRELRHDCSPPILELHHGYALDDIDDHV